MYKKALFTPAEMQGMFKTDSQKYNVLKKDIAKIILCYLIANRAIKTSCNEVYKKALNTQAKNLLCNPNVTTLKEAEELVELTAKSEVSLEKENYTADGTIRLIMKLFLTLE